MMLRSGLLWLFLPLLAASGPDQGENWPRFRGPSGQGHSSETGLPVEWNATTNVLWKTPLPGEGWSSPIVWGDRIFLTSTTEGGTRCHVLGIDRKSGKSLWDKVVFDQVANRKEGKNSYATPTPCTDGDRVCAVFGDGSAAALDLEGNLLWTNREVQFYSRHGLGASPILHDGLLIMPYDGSNRVAAAGQWPKNSDEERLGWQLPWDKSEIVALDAKTGRRAWVAKRGMSRIAHATPIVLKEGGRELLLSIAGDVVQVFDPKTGERIWSVYCQGEGLVPSPVTGGGLIFAASGYEKTTLRAIKGDGKGDLPASAIVWEQKKGVPTQPSLLYVEPHLYAITEGGVASCFKPATGEVVWQERIADKQTFSASPVYADGKIYILSETGETTVIAAGAEFKVLARNPLQEKCQASIAVSRGNLFIRSDKNLYCIGQAR